jgi:hypothetical protein
MPLAGFEPATPATEQPQTYDLDRVATGIEIYALFKNKSNRTKLQHVINLNRRPHWKSVLKINAAIAKMPQILHLSVTTVSHLTEGLCVVEQFPLRR